MTSCNFVQKRSGPLLHKRHMVTRLILNKQFMVNKAIRFWPTMGKGNYSFDKDTSLFLLYYFLIWRNGEEMGIEIMS